MFLTSFIHQYLLWHYKTALGEIWHLYKNFVWFLNHFFSIPQLIKSFFSPWRRITEDRGKGFHLEAIAAYIIINLFSRLIGASIRLIIISAGLSAILISIIGLILFYLFWFVAPAAVPTLLFIGTVLLII